MKKACIFLFCFAMVFNCEAQIPYGKQINIKAEEVNEIQLKKKGKNPKTLSGPQARMFVHFVNYAAQDQDCIFESADFSAEIVFQDGSTKTIYLNRNCITEDHETWYNIGDPEFLQKIWK